MSNIIKIKSPYDLILFKEFCNENINNKIYLELRDNYVSVVPNNEKKVAGYLINIQNKHIVLRSANTKNIYYDPNSLLSLFSVNIYDIISYKKA